METSTLDKSTTDPAKTETKSTTSSENVTVSDFGAGQLTCPTQVQSPPTAHWVAHPEMLLSRALASASPASGASSQQTDRESNVLARAAHRLTASQVAEAPHARAVSHPPLVAMQSWHPGAASG